MKKTLIYGALSGVLFMASCTDHEVIPPPVPLVDLDCLCEGTLDGFGGTDTSFTYDDTCKYSSTKTISTISLSNAEYQTQILNLAMNQGVELEMRSVYWTDDGTNNPTSADWQAYFEGNLLPVYSENQNADGVIVRWTDPNGKIWVSDTGSVCIKNFTYNLFTYDTDTTGEYMKFDAVFNCRMLNSDYGVIDSARCLTNGHIKSAFRRE